MVDANFEQLISVYRCLLALEDCRTEINHSSWKLSVDDDILLTLCPEFDFGESDDVKRYGFHIEMLSFNDVDKISTKFFIEAKLII